MTESTLPVLLKNPRMLLVGGGNVALQKASVLINNHISFDLLAHEYVEEFNDLKIFGIKQYKDLEVEDLKDYNIIVDATGDQAVATMLLQEKQTRFLLVNRVDDPASSDFYFSSLINYGRLKVAVSTDGASPAIGQVVRDRIKSVLSDDIAGLLDQKEVERANGKIDSRQSREEAFSLMARVDLVGCGPGDPELLTLLASRIISEADVLLYDHLIPDAILELASPSAKRIYVGKQKDQHSQRQDEINLLILEQVRQGLRVARLKSGDPYVFGRGAEEAEYLAHHGICVRVVPGVSSAVAGPAAAGIPLTARGYATNVSIVSAHLAGNHLNTDWLSLLEIPKHTTVVLMGLSFAQDIANLAMRKGIPESLPVAIVSNATRDTQSVIVTTLSELKGRVCEAQKPAVLIFGDVVKLHGVLPHWQAKCHSL